nr:fasciclin domain-containing protein [uncultured Draconibacterium sp.]
MKSRILVAFAALAMIVVSCSDDYYTNGGLLDEHVGLLNISTMDYLKANAEFDTLVTLIQLSGLENAVDEQGNTFMAPQDYSIYNYFKLTFSTLDTPPTSLSEIPDEIMNEIKIILENYIIPNEKIMRKDLSSSYTYTTTLAGQSARYNLLRSDYLGNVNSGAEIINYSLNTNGDGNSYQSVWVVTSNLVSTTGVLHILNANSHIFGFN